MERIAEMIQKVPACCRKDTFGLPLVRRNKTQCGLLTQWLITISLRDAFNLLPAEPDDNGNTHFSEPLRRHGRWDAVSGVCLIPPDLPLFDWGDSLGGGSKSDRLVDHRDELCWLSLPSTRLFGRNGAEFPHDCRETKPARAPAAGSPMAP
jgi:hypothetical protein